MPSTFRYTSQPVALGQCGARHSGVPPSPRVIGFQLSLDRQPIPVGRDQAGPGEVDGGWCPSLIRRCLPIGERWSTAVYDVDVRERGDGSDERASAARWVTTTIERRSAGGLVDHALWRTARC